MPPNVDISYVEHRVTGSSEIFFFSEMLGCRCQDDSIKPCVCVCVYIHMYSTALGVAAEFTFNAGL